MKHKYLNEIKNQLDIIQYKYADIKIIGEPVTFR